MPTTEILIVDDHVDTLRALSRLLHSQGYDTHAIDNGAEAIEYLKTHLPKLVVLDRMMPNIDGLQVLRFIRQDQRLKNVAVIDYSAAGKNEKDDDLARLGVQARLTKGAGWEALLAAINQLTAPPTNP